MTQYRQLVLGGPGCGKTTHLLSIVGDYLNKGVLPHQIAYVAFTRKAASEAKQRAQSQFGLSESDLPYFRTLHSFAFKELGMGQDQLMTSNHYNELGDLLKIKFGSVENEFGMITEQRERGSQYYHIEQQSRLRCLTLKQMCLLDGRQGSFLVQHYQDSLRAFKGARGIVDYTDILELWLSKMHVLPIKVLIIDEAQDLSPLQWKLVEGIQREVPFVYFAGDDDQAIYEWAGADVNCFLNLNAERKVLPISYRLPRQVFARCDRIVKRIRHRYTKNWSPAPREGLVTTVGAAEMAPMQSGEWMVLARNHYQLEGTAGFLKSKGYIFNFNGRSSLSSVDALAAKAWIRSQACERVTVGDIKRILARFPKARLKGNKEVIFSMRDDQAIPKEILSLEYGIDLSMSWEQSLIINPEERIYIQSALRRERNLDLSPRIRLNTIHAVKGGECDNVLLLPDMSAACHDSFIRRPDTEARVFYVGASRAKEQLVVCQPQTSKYFPI